MACAERQQQPVVFDFAENVGCSCLWYRCQWNTCQRRICMGSQRYTGMAERWLHQFRVFNWRKTCYSCDARGKVLAFCQHVKAVPRSFPLLDSILKGCIPSQNPPPGVSLSIKALLLVLFLLLYALVIFRICFHTYIICLFMRWL